jgi:hypothetical protein
MHPEIETILRADAHAPECSSVADWWPLWLRGAARSGDPVAMALAGGWQADRVGWAFASGYQAALRRLIPGLAPQKLAAFCVTEEGGNRPRDITTRIEPDGGSWTVSGAKRWTTLGPHSSTLFVVGTLGAATLGRPALKVVRVECGAPGLQLQPMPATGFVPEVPHARVRLDGVRVAAEALLPGDGYDAYVKPFRTIEDAHVTLAVLAYLLREARVRGWAPDFAERVVATLVALADIAAAPPDAPATHVALAGALHVAHALYGEAGARWAATPEDPAARRWQRDSGLFSVAGAARTQRAVRAWERLRASA